MTGARWVGCPGPVTLRWHVSSTYWTSLRDFHTDGFKPGSSASCARCPLAVSFCSPLFSPTLFPSLPSSTLPAEISRLYPLLSGCLPVHLLIKRGFSVIVRTHPSLQIPFPISPSSPCPLCVPAHPHFPLSPDRSRTSKITFLKDEFNSDNITKESKEAMTIKVRLAATCRGRCLQS